MCNDNTLMETIFGLCGLLTTACITISLRLKYRCNFYNRISSQNILCVYQLWDSAASHLFVYLVLVI